MAYKRIKGGEKNIKSGVRWTKDELILVYKLYKKLNGVGLHEHNPAIQELAMKLGRTVRSTEAQTLMFRNLERSGSYSHGNMNKLTRAVWNDFESKEGMNNMVNNDNLIENQLYSWSSESKGGVRKPFDDRTGRPLGNRIDTPICKRINELLKSQDSVRAIFLIGGPGNGKTDTMEYIVERLDKEYSLDGKLLSRVHKAFIDYDWIESIDIKDFDISYDSIELIQDASDHDPKTDGNSTRPLVNLLNQICSKDYRGFCVCCINRGILDSLKREIAKDNEGSLVTDRARELFHELMKSIGPRSPLEGKDCWPFFGDYYAWPMDVDSLLDYHNSEFTIGEEIFESALEFDFISDSIDNTAGHFNFKSLKDQKTRRNLVRILRKCEINGSYRFTFRELFSIAAKILHIDQPKKPVSQSKETKKDNYFQTLTSIHSDWSQLYYNKLFNHDGLYNIRGNLIKDVTQLKTKDMWQQDNCDVRKVLNIILSKIRRSGSYIERMIGKEDFQSLDPGRSSSRNVIQDTDLSFFEIEKAFSVGIEHGLERCQKHLNELEKDFLKLLSRAELDSLNIDDIIRSQHVKARGVIGFLRRYCSIIVKRAIGSRSGEVNGNEMIEGYLEALSNENKLREFISNSLLPAIYKEGKFKVSLGTSIGQSKESMVEDVVLYFYKGDTPKPIPLDHRNQPNWSLLAISSGNGNDIIINYDLYQAIYRKGMLSVDAGCLSSEVMIGLDIIVSQISAKSIHSHSDLAVEGLQMYLGDELILKFGYDGKFGLVN